MNISRYDLYRIILEEYAHEEGLDESKVDDLIAHIKGGPKPDWMDDDERDVPDPPEVPPAPDQSDATSSETYPMEVPHSADMTDEDIISSISQMIRGRDPEHVSELFQAVFEKLPGVELSSPGDEDYPGEETLYSPGAEGRPTAGFRLEELVKLIREVLEEGHYHDMGGDDEVYDVLDDEPGDIDMSEYYEMLETSPDKIPDDVLKDMMEIDGMEEMIVLDGEGGLANREEVIEALKDV